MSAGYFTSGKVVSREEAVPEGAAKALVGTARKGAGDTETGDTDDEEDGGVDTVGD